jgi:uncharacterized membrane protein (UPF0127 family)
MVRVAVFGGLLILGFAGCKPDSSAKSETLDKLGQVEMMIGGTKVTLEVADDPDSRRQGLMFRDSLLQDHGMLFVFPYEAIYPFWMKNTRIPLSIAFINSAGEIVGISQMQPFDTTTMHMPFRPFQYAIEMEQGWFGTHGVQKGDTLRIPLRP